MNLFLRRKTTRSYPPFSRQAWDRFSKSRLNLAAGGYILFLVLVAIAGYLVTPDPSPSTNRQILEIAVKRPGFSLDFLAVPRENDPANAGLLKTIALGKPPRHTLLPLHSYVYRGDTLHVTLYSGDDDVPGQVLSFGPGTGIGPGQVTRKTFLLGTDQFGRDVLSRLMIGTRVSLAVGLVSVLISLLIGIAVGAAGGYYRGRIDTFIVWLINVVWSVPTLLLVIAITFALGKGFWQIFVAVGLTMWVEVARVVRGQVLAVREVEYIEAARALGLSDLRIMMRHILPNISGAIIVISAANFAAAILIEAGLSFLGIGVQPPSPSWGNMIRENYAYLVLDASWLALLPGLAIMSLVLAFMIVGNGLRDALDVKENAQKAV